MWHLYGVFYQIAVRVPGAVWLKRLLVGRPRPEFWFLSCILRTAAYPVCLSGLRQEVKPVFFSHDGIRPFWQPGPEY
jgi:hypothetical protein